MPPRVFLSIENGTLTEIAADLALEVVVFDVDRLRRSEGDYGIERELVAASPEAVDAALDGAERAVARGR